MIINELTTRLIALLLPGAIAASITDTLTVHKKWDNFRFLLNAVLFGSLTYSLMQAALYLINPILEYSGYQRLSICFWAAILDTKSQVHVGEIIVASFAAIVLGFINSACVQKKAIFRIAKNLHVSRKFGDEGLFSYFCARKSPQYVWVRDKEEGITYAGTIKDFSAAGTLRELTLVDVEVYSTETGDKLYELERAFLPFTEDKFIIEIPKEDEETSEEE